MTTPRRHHSEAAAPAASGQGVRPRVQLVGNDAESKLIDIYLSGFLSGAASGSKVLADTSGTTMDRATAERICDELAHGLTDRISADPLILEAIRREITEILIGVDSGPKNIRLAPTDTP